MLSLNLFSIELMYLLCYISFPIGTLTSIDCQASLIDLSLRTEDEKRSKDKLFHFGSRPPDAIGNGTLLSIYQ